MRIGVPREIKVHEYRVGLVPAGVRELTAAGHEVLLEAGAGVGIGIADAEYQAVGARIVPGAAGGFAGAELIVKVKEPQPAECAMLRPDQVLFTYLHLAADPQQTAALRGSGCVAIAYETITDAAGRLPLLAPMSEVAGRMAPQVGAHELERPQGGMGVLMGGVPGVLPARVLVIGAGPSGMEAARCSAVRGHRVTIFDKQPKLGGLIPLAGTVKDVEVDDMMAFVDWEDGQFKKLGVRQELGREVTSEVIDELKPDVIIVAAGGTHVMPDIPGFDGATVLTSAKLHKRLKLALKYVRPQTVAKLSKLYLPWVGKRVVIIGGKIMGCETAEFLTKRGRKVTIVETGDNLGEGMTGDDKYLLFPWFDKKGVKRYIGAGYKNIASGRLTITTKEGKEETIQADTIITTLPLDPND